MSTVTAGNPVTLDAHFALSGQPTPDAVTFNVQLPDDTVQSYVFGVDAEVTNPSGTYYECAIGVPPEVGEYRWGAVGTDGSEAAVTETIWGTVFVIQSAVNPEGSVPDGPMLGPCSTWITGQDVAACLTADFGSSPDVLDQAAWEASMALYEISGRTFPGLCERSVRPCRNRGDCGHWSAGITNAWWWGGSSWGSGTWGWGWYGPEGASLIGCKPMSTVRLAGYPVRKITEVLIGGEPLDEFDVDGNRQWRLDRWRYLIRMDTPGSPVQPNFWPGCQNMSLDPDQPGTFEITYEWGTTPPSLGRTAAIELAVQIWLQCSGAACKLPTGATKIERQGITIERGLLANWLDPTKETGLVAVDLFLQAYAGGQRHGRRSAVWTPDVQEFARKLGTGSASGS